MNGLDLFSGIGGISLALSEWVRPVAYCEIEPYATGVLFSRMLDGTLPTAPVYPDIRHLTKKILPSCDIVYGGFPCQPYSSAARGRNLQDTIKHEAVRLIREISPRFVFFENVETKAFDDFREDLERTGFTVKEKQVRASDVGAPHIRERCWLFGDSNSDGKPTMYQHGEMAQLSENAEAFWEQDSAEDIRMDDGLPFRVDRIRCLGNAVVPLCAKRAFEELMGLSSPKANS